MKKEPRTSWGKVSGWYDELLEDRSGTYQSTVILPSILRLLGDVKGITALDLACGQGFFARALAEKGMRVIAVDASKNLIALAKKHEASLAHRNAASKNPPIEYHVSPADSLPFIADQSIDAITIILAIQNIEQVDGVFKECARVLRRNGKLHVVMNHPAFRIPQGSSWGWDPSTSLGTSASAPLGANTKGMQYRRVDKYLSESKIKIQMHPGDAPNEYTVSFHRPLQYYAKHLAKYGFGIVRLEEWISNKKSQPGPRAKAEDAARHEIPLFLYVQGKYI